MIPLALGLAAASSLYDSIRGTGATANTAATATGATSKSADPATPFTPDADATGTAGAKPAKPTGLDPASARRVAHHKAALLALQAGLTGGIAGPAAAAPGSAATGAAASRG